MVYCAFRRPDTHGRSGWDVFDDIFEARPHTEIWVAPIDGSGGRLVHTEERWLGHPQFRPGDQDTEGPPLGIEQEGGGPLHLLRGSRHQGGGGEGRGEDPRLGGVVPADRRPQGVQAGAVLEGLHEETPPGDPACPGHYSPPARRSGAGKIRAPGAAPLWERLVGSSIPETDPTEASSGKIIFPCM